MRCASAAVVVLLVVPTSAVGGPCQSDVDCKGDRICVNGKCDWPAAQGSEATLSKAKGSGAQSKNPDISWASACGWLPLPPRQLTVGVPSDEATELLGEIERAGGVGGEIVLRAAPVGMTVAVARIGTKFDGDLVREILFDWAVVQRLQGESEQGGWAVKFIFAHEYAHHVLGHSISLRGSEPQREFDADAWAARVLFKLGASADDAAHVFRVINTPRSPTHPASSERISAIRRAWDSVVEEREREAARQRKECRGSFQYLALLKAGHADSRLYVGGWSEWGNTPELPLGSQK